ncbi:DUF5684 domain-containing protein [Halpernia frigidisoli]|uniref:Signal peptidase I n=1 Tax=Halpernia frigidisoli TaxID=1125876 RepID=A0A1I3IIP9_9FLAO|nr:DUF5684 domain-containing protein [Halpernia frigidisoli]SFI47770.1 hypothetical protein SAMN05443292_2630 [Halpernia frigidisoli]
MENNQQNINIFIILIFALTAILFTIFLLVCRWKIFEKAGQDGWKSLIPIYNIIILLEITKKPSWWIFLLLIPIYNFYIAITLNIRLSKSFGKDDLFGILLTFLNFIFEPILAFGDSKYNPNLISDDQNSTSWT